MRLRTPHVVGTVSAVALSLGLAAGALAVPPPGNVDQSHECAAATCNTDASVGAYPVVAPMLGGGAEQDVSLGQTFTAGVTGNLTAVQIYVSTFDATIPDTFDVRVESTTSGEPSGTVLGTVAVPTSGILGQPVWVTATFATAIPITAGTVYAITLAPAVATNSGWLSWSLDSTDVAAYTDYAGGSAFAYAAGGGGWTNGGDAFYDSASVTTDFAFRTIVAAAAPTPTASIPSAPPTETVSAGTASSAGGGLPVALALLAIVGAAAFVASARTNRTSRTNRRRA